eukprot:gnl/TRDRNA2_/TRDRNA2_186378_c0_seq1.p1 gnl/TRDRNA2_/TRDRNA2_186378_c0~~gnl/TRDRNA2_/TRDRNA2_186378_c0_seq1.p1  ORF type:complete len:158 (+),score=45.20 gnl/TRDRNA2_/TRDRNA2_186378_c0_seq1:61-534(+)
MASGYSSADGGTDVYGDAVKKMVAYMSKSATGEQQDVLLPGGALLFGGDGEAQKAPGAPAPTAPGVPMSVEDMSDAQKKEYYLQKAHYDLTSILRDFNGRRACYPRSHNANAKDTLAKDTADAWKKFKKDPPPEGSDVTVAMLLRSYTQAKKNQEVI